VAAIRPLELRFTLRAHQQLQSIFNYIHDRNPAAARSVARRIRFASEMLSYFPEAGRLGESEGTREWVVRGLPYIMVYQVSNEPALTVLGVFHAAQGERKI
jgi:plasmid stabilization system protein ParE